jgi:small-conductance mechanosensitive channel
MTRQRTTVLISLPVFCALLLVLALVVPAGAPGATSQGPGGEPSGARVEFDGQTLFSVQERVLAFSPEDRAAAITKRIREISETVSNSTNTIGVVETDVDSEIVFGDRVIMAVTDRDAKAAGRPRQALAADYATAIQRAIEAHRKTYSLKSIALGAAFLLLATIILVVAFILIGRFFTRAYATINALCGTKIRSIRIQALEVLSADRMAALLIGLLKGVHVAVVLVLIYFYLPLAFSFFPWTHGLAGTLFGYVFSPLRVVIKGFVSYLPNVFFIAVIVAVAYYINKFVKLIFWGIERGTIVFPGFHRDWADPTFKIVRFLIIAFTAVVIAPYLPGAHSPAFQGVTIFLGVLFSLGSTATIANVVAGVILTYMRAFKIGDRVKIADTVGDVLDRTLWVTRVRTIKNVHVTIPNAMVLGSHIINYSSAALGAGLILHTSVTIGYDAPWKTVHALLIAAARATDHILKEPAPYVLQTGLNDFFVTYELNAYTNQPVLMAKIYSDLHQNIQDQFNQAGVEIMSPHYSALRDGNRIAIPDDHLPKGYRAPAFRVGPPGAEPDV